MPQVQQRTREGWRHLSALCMLLLSLLGFSVQHRMLTFIINILKADIKVNFIGKVNNTEAAEGMMEISSTFDHMFQFLLFIVYDCGIKKPAAKQLPNLLVLYCDEFKMTYV